MNLLKKANKKLIRKYKKLKIWNQSFLLKNRLDDKSCWYIIIFYILNIYLVFKDIKRFHIF